MMPVPDQRCRRPLRVPGYDYSQAGAYFVTVCTHKRVSLFGSIIEGEMHLNDIGQIVQQSWMALPARFLRIDLDAFVVMPNHIHGIIVLGAYPEDESGPRHATGIGVGVDSGAQQWAAVGDDLDSRAQQAAPVPGVNEGSHDPTKNPGFIGTGAACCAPFDPASRPPAAPTLGAVMRAFKSTSAIACNRALGRAGQPFWHRGYYEHIIRNDRGLDRIRRYIANNPGHWAKDPENA